MNKSEFMEKLSASLKANQPGEAADGLLADFNDHFDEALHAGKSEAEICEMLGNPAEIAAECCEEFDRSAEPPGDSDVYIGLYQMNLIVEPRDSDEFHVEVRQNGKVVQDDNIQIKQGKNSLQVIQAREQDFMRRLFRAFKFSEVVCVGIPRRWSGDMSVKMTSGNARLAGVATAGNLRCELTSGNVHMLELSAGGSLAVCSRSGNVTVENCAGDLFAECRSGNIRVRSHKGNVLHATTTSGNVKVEAGHLQKDCALEVTSGNLRIDLDKLEADLKLDCRSGNIRFSIRELGGNITGKTRSGNINGSLSRDTRAVFLLQSTGVHNTFPSAAMPDPGVPVVNLTSRSGIVRIREL